MLFVVAVWLAAFLSAVNAQRVWSVSTRTEVLDALTKCAAGDSIELEPGEYVFGALGGGEAPLAIDKALTFKSRNEHQRATLRASDSSFLFTVTASDVLISDLIIGRQPIGGDERSIDIFIGAGTQKNPATSRHAYSVSDKVKRSMPSHKEIVDSRTLYGSDTNANRKRAVPAGLVAGGDVTLRALHNVSVVNVDFTKSRSGANVAFSRGSYADILVTRCAFGRAGATYINALVTAADARFVNFVVSLNNFVDTEVLVGSASVDVHSFNTNYWQPVQNIFIGGTRVAVDTYCVDSLCSVLAPVVDLDSTNSVFSSLKEALASGSTRVRIVRDIVIDEVLTVARPGTTIEGNEGCNGAPLITMTRSGSIVSFNGALAGMRNLRFALVEENSAAIVFTDGVAQTLNVVKFAESLLTETNGVVDNAMSTANAVVGFDGVSFLGTDAVNQVAVLVNSPRVRIETEDTLVAQVRYGFVAHRGVIVTSSTSVFGASSAAIYAETTTRQAGIRVTDSTFVDCEAPVQLGANAGAANLREFRISCSQFLFNRHFSPIDSKDCIKLPALCASALTYNTIVTEFDDVAAVSDKVPVPESVRAERRMLRSGMNHIEAGRKREEFVYFGGSNSFSLRDSQGRLSTVSGVVNGGDRERAFLLATYAPLRAECTPLDASMFGPSASIVSSVLEVRSDALLHECATMSASFTIANDTLMPALADVAIYGVTRLGSNPVWDRKHTTSHAVIDEHTGVANIATAVVETSFALHDARDSHDHRIIVVSHAPLPDVVAHALASGAAKTVDQSRLVTRSLCVACGNTTTIPAYLIDAHCAGSSDNIRTDFDAAYTELGFGASMAPRQEAVSMFIYGSCETRRCTVVIDQNEIVEGASMIVRGSLRRAKTLKCNTDEPLVQFSDRSSKASMRYMSIEAQSSDSHGSCAIVVTSSNSNAAVGGPTISYSSINGALCIDSRAGGRYIGNDIVSDYVAVLFDFKQPPTKKHNDQPVIFEANRISKGSVHIVGPPTSAVQDKQASSLRWQVHADRNSFNGASDIGFSTLGETLGVLVSNAKQVGLLENDDSLTSHFIATQIELVQGAILNLHHQASVSFTANFIAQNVSALLEDTAHLSDIAFDTDSVVTILRNASVVLRQVLFENVEMSLATAPNLAPCASTEKSTVGIDALRSTIFNAQGNRIFTQQQVSIVNAAGTSQYFGLDGSLLECQNGASRVRDDAVCDCPENIVTEAATAVQSSTTLETTTSKAPRTPKPKKVKSLSVAAIPNQIVQAIEQEIPVEGAPEHIKSSQNNIVVAADDEPVVDENSNNDDRRAFSFFWIGLAVFAVIILICLGVFCFMRYNTFATTTIVQTASKMGQRAQARDTEQPPALKQNRGSRGGGTLANEFDALAVEAEPVAAHAASSTTTSSPSSSDNISDAKRKKVQHRTPKKANE